MEPLIPANFEKYIEPFVGAGALYFAQNHRNSIISDSNEELIVTYEAVRDDVEGVIKALGRFSHDKESFYQIRSLDTSKLGDLEHAARLIYLNKTCFNGLYRVNQKGEFNTPCNGAIISTPN